MESISCKCPFLPIPSLHIKYPSPSQKNQPVLPLTRGRRRRRLPLNPIRSPLHLTTLAINSITPPSIDAVVDSPASSGDISVLIPISILLLFVYWLANFVVPNMISKDFSLERPSEEEPTTPLGTSMPGSGRSKGKE